MHLFEQTANFISFFVAVTSLRRASSKSQKRFMCVSEPPSYHSEVIVSVRHLYVKDCLLVEKSCRSEFRMVCCTGTSTLLNDGFRVGQREVKRQMILVAQQRHFYGVGLRKAATTFDFVEILIVTLTSLTLFIEPLT